MERLHPGVYIEEVPSSVRPIEGVSTSTAAFLGAAASGRVLQPLLVTSFSDFKRHFGGFIAESYLAHSALNFFNNGGRRLYILRVSKDHETAAVGIADRKESPILAMTVEAASPGAWGNEVDVVVAASSADPDDEFRLTVREEEFDNLSMNPDAVNFAPHVVNAASRLVRIKVNEDNESTVAGTSRSGLPAFDTGLPAERRRLRININGDGPQTVTLADPVGDADEIAAAIQAAVTDLAPLRATTATEAFSAFKAAFSEAEGRYVLTSGAPGKRSSVVVTDDDDSLANCATLLKLGVKNGGSETTGAAQLRPAVGTFFLGDGTVSGPTLSVTLGSDGTTPADQDYIDALPLLDPIRMNILAIPGIGSTNVAEHASRYCERRKDSFFVADMTSDSDDTTEAQEYVAKFTSSYAAVYFPWVRATDPAGSDPNPILSPPSGFVSGVYARIDARRGVWKAPAGTEASIFGALGLAADIGDAQQDILNPVGVNVIRSFPSSGVVIWGARTLAGSNSEYRYVSVRRFAIFLQQSIYDGIQWAVFEPNDEDLWSSLRLNINAFMMTLFRSGAFQGDTPSKAFDVKCDAETNPQDQIDLGIVTVLVKFAPLKPAEFVVIKISQKTAEAA